MLGLVFLSKIKIQIYDIEKFVPYFWLVIRRFCYTSVSQMIYLGIGDNYDLGLKALISSHNNS